MPDITMCSGVGCDKRQECWRYAAPPSRHQAYFSAPPAAENGCEWFWDRFWQEKSYTKKAPDYEDA